METRKGKIRRNPLRRKDGKSPEILKHGAITITAEASRLRRWVWESEKKGVCKPNPSPCKIILWFRINLLSFRFLLPILVEHSHTTVEQSDKIDNFYVKVRVSRFHVATLCRQSATNSKGYRSAGNRKRQRVVKSLHCQSSYFPRNIL